MLSGIGPAPDLRSLGIAPAVNNSHVGQHLADHPRVSNQFGLARPELDVTDTIGRNTTLFDALLQEWEGTQPHQGVLSNGGSNQVGWFRLPEDDPIWGTEDDPSTGPTSPHYELLFRVRLLPQASEGARELTHHVSQTSLRLSGCRHPPPENS